jgi:hypothetical protein
MRGAASGEAATFVLIAFAASGGARTERIGRAALNASAQLLTPPPPAPVIWMQLMR